MNNSEGFNPAQQIDALMAECQVKALPACKRAGMATSTLFRWGKGQRPKQGQVDRLRLAVLTIAEGAGTLPADKQAELERLQQSVTLPQPTSLEHRVSRLEKAVTEQLGAQL